MTDKPRAGAPGRKVSVVLLSYNHAATVGEALRTALQQTEPADEVLVSDDHSTDESWGVLEEIASTHSRVRLVRPPRNVGMASNANFVVAQSSGSYVALLHHDDVYRNDLLERWSAVLDRHGDVAFVFNRYREGGRVSEDSFDERTDGPTFLRERLLKSWGSPVRGTAMIRRSAWDAVGGMRESFGLLADVDLWMRLAAKWAVGFVDEPLISVGEDRPAGYPDDYVRLSWRRNRLLYEIHAANVDEAYPQRGSRRLRRLRLRAGVSVDAAKWLAYAAVRRPGLLADADEGATPLELAPVRVARRLAASWARRRGRAEA